jgi:hypothetical protein
VRGAAARLRRARAAAAALARGSLRALRREGCARVARAAA